MAEPSARRAELLDALVEVFLAEGFLRFTVADLALRLRCSKSTLYAVAPSREQLITAVVRAAFKSSTERVEERLARSTDPVERIEVYLETIATELSAGGPQYYADLDAFAPAGEIYAHNTAVAARRVQDLVTAAKPHGSEQEAAFLGAVAAQTMQAVQRGQVQRLTGLDDGAAYRALAELVVAGVVTDRGRSVR